jgi:hypothetical protein
MPPDRVIEQAFQTMSIPLIPLGQMRQIYIYIYMLFITLGDGPIDSSPGPAERPSQPNRLCVGRLPCARAFFSRSDPRAPTEPTRLRSSQPMSQVIVPKLNHFAVNELSHFALNELSHFTSLN